MNNAKTKTYFRGNNLIGLKPVVGVVVDEGLIEAKRYAATRGGGDAAPRLPETPAELLERSDQIDVELIIRGR